MSVIAHLITFLANFWQKRKGYNLNDCNPLIISVEHIGIEPMTS